MPFQSEKQRRYLWATQPDLAKRWAHEYPASNKGLPMYAKDNKAKKKPAPQQGGEKRSNLSLFDNLTRVVKNRATKNLHLVNNGVNFSQKTADSKQERVEIPHSEAPTYAGEEREKGILSQEFDDHGGNMPNAAPAGINALLHKLSVVLSPKVREMLAAQQAAQQGQPAGPVAQNQGIKQYPAAPTIAPPMGMQAPAAAPAQQSQQAQQPQQPQQPQQAPPVGGGQSPNANPINAFGGISSTGDINGNAAFGTQNAIGARKFASDSPLGQLLCINEKVDWDIEEIDEAEEEMFGRRKAAASANTPCSCGCGDTVATCKCSASCKCRKPGGSCYRGEKKAMHVDENGRLRFTPQDAIVGAGIGLTGALGGALYSAYSQRKKQPKLNPWHAEVKKYMDQGYEPIAAPDGDVTFRRGDKHFWWQHDNRDAGLQEITPEQAAEDVEYSGPFNEPELMQKKEKKAEADNTAGELSPAWRALLGAGLGGRLGLRGGMLAGGVAGLGHGLLASPGEYVDAKGEKKKRTRLQKVLHDALAGVGMGGAAGGVLGAAGGAALPFLPTKQAGAATLFAPRTAMKYDPQLHKMLQNWERAGGDNNLFGSGSHAVIDPALAKALSRYVNQSNRGTAKLEGVRTTKVKPREVDDVDAAHTLLELESMQPKQAASSPAWQRSAGKNPEGGLNEKGRKSYERETGGNLKAPVTESNPSGERAKRQNSFCSRMCGMKRVNTGAKTKSDPDSRINKSLRKWNCKCSSFQSAVEKWAGVVKRAYGVMEDYGMTDRTPWLFDNKTDYKKFPEYLRRAAALANEQGYRLGFTNTRYGEHVPAEEYANFLQKRPLTGLDDEFFPHFFEMNAAPDNKSLRKIVEAYPSYKQWPVYQAYDAIYGQKETPAVEKQSGWADAFRAGARGARAGRRVGEQMEHDADQNSDPDDNNRGAPNISPLEMALTTALLSAGAYGVYHKGQQLLNPRGGKKKKKQANPPWQ